MGNAEICQWNRHINVKEVQGLHFFFLGHIQICLTLTFLPIPLLMSRKAGGSYTQSKFAESVDSKDLYPNGVPNRPIKSCHCTYVNICQAQHGGDISCWSFQWTVSGFPLLIVKSLKINNIMNIYHTTQFTQITYIPSYISMIKREDFDTYMIRFIDWKRMIVHYHFSNPY